MVSRVEHIGDATLYLGDCREILRSLQGAWDSVASDPPFGMAFQSNYREVQHDKIAKAVQESLL